MAYAFKALDTLPLNKQLTVLKIITCTMELKARLPEVASPSFAINQSPNATDIFFIDAENRKISLMSDKLVTEEFKLLDYTKEADLRVARGDAAPSLRDLMGQEGYALALDLALCSTFKKHQSGPLEILMNGDVPRSEGKDKQFLKMAHGFIMPSLPMMGEGNGFVISSNRTILDSLKKLHVNIHKHLMGFNPGSAVAFWCLDSGVGLDVDIGRLFVDKKILFTSGVQPWLMMRLLGEEVGEIKAQEIMKEIMHADTEN